MKDIKKIDTFSANSLKVLDRSLDEFINKYALGLSFSKKDQRALLGDKYHSLICSYLRGFDITKLLLDLKKDERDNFNKFIKLIEDKKEGFIETEYSFLIKESLNNTPYYLTGRFDAVWLNPAPIKTQTENKAQNSYIIYDWKTLNLPKNPESDLQTVVYLYALYKIFNTTSLTIRYTSIEKCEFVDVEFSKPDIYKGVIDGVVGRYYRA